MEERLDKLLERPPVYTKEDGENTELDKLKKGIAKHRDYIFRTTDLKGFHDDTIL
jgi:hypothetical protein